jgi:Domain found in Dishevelled, Egl-10, and Pleckstrin (DEP)
VGGRGGLATDNVHQSITFALQNAPTLRTSPVQRRCASLRGNAAPMGEAELRDILPTMTDPTFGVTVKTQRGRGIKSYKNCMSGFDASEWMGKFLNLDREAATRIGQVLLDSGFLEDASSNHELFCANRSMFYRFTDKVSSLLQASGDTERREKRKSMSVKVASDGSTSVWAAPQRQGVTKQLTKRMPKLVVSKRPSASASISGSGSHSGPSPSSFSYSYAAPNSIAAPNTTSTSGGSSFSTSSMLVAAQK